MWSESDERERSLGKSSVLQTLAVAQKPFGTLMGGHDRSEKTLDTLCITGQIRVGTIEKTSNLCQFGLVDLTAIQQMSKQRGC